MLQKDKRIPDELCMHAHTHTKHTCTRTATRILGFSDYYLFYPSLTNLSIGVSSPVTPTRVSLQVFARELL